MDYYYKALCTLWKNKIILNYNNKTYVSPFYLLGTKRQRISNETDHDTGSESSPSSPPRLNHNHNPHHHHHHHHHHGVHHQHDSNKNSPNGLYGMPTLVMSSPSRTGPPSSPESDLDVDSAPDDATPENLSLKREDSVSPSPPHSQSPADSLSILRHVANAGHLNGGTGGGVGGHGGFMPYHHHPAQFMAAANAIPAQRSPIDVLLR